MKKMNISDAELELLKELWVESPLTSRQLVDRLQVRTQWGEPNLRSCGGCSMKRRPHRMNSSRSKEGKRP